MNIAHIIPGSGGGFYCGNCLRDGEMFKAIRNQGHNAVITPMYLPLFMECNNKDDVPVFFGAISIYLKHRYPVLQKLPNWVDGILNSGPMLKLAAKFAGSTRSTGLEDMTISMLMGEHGKQKDELEKLVSWLENHFKPDVVHISNALLLGLAKKLKERLNVPVFCSLQDEDTWVECMKPEAAKKAWELMQDSTQYVDMFVSVSDYYKSFMKDRLKLTEEKLKTLHLGVEPDNYKYINASKKPRNIGYLSRLSKDKGLDILIDAFIELKKHEKNKNVKLLLTGGYTADDSKFVIEQKAKIKNAGLNDDVVFMHSFENEGRKEFLNSVQVLSVPVRSGDAFGIYLLEAMASGIPVVQPARGAFPEIIQKSGGGITYNDNSASELAKTLDELLNDKEKLNNLSLQARKGIEKEFNINYKAHEMIGLYVDFVTNS